jgi:Flp pilus assembly protein TadG
MRLQTFTQFLRNQAGNATFMGFALFMILIGGVGSAIDVSRSYMVRTKVSNSLDAAGLAAGAVASQQDIQLVAAKYFNANFSGEFAGTETISITATPNADNTIIDLAAVVEVPATFMKVFGHDKTRLTVNSQITRSNKGLELVLVMDNTGSMGWDGKLTAMKSAATDLVNILYGDDNDAENLFIGLVPFSQAVNVGKTHTGWIQSNSYNWGPTSWAGCVDAREDGGDVTDDPPATDPFIAYYWPDDSNNDWSYYNRRGRLRYREPLNTSRGPNKYCPDPIAPMTTSKTTILTAIDDMGAAGNTHINLGAAWGWRLLSPRWRNLWGGDMDSNSLPLDYNAPLMNKAVVLLTDGDNTMSNGTRSAYWYLNDGKLGTTSSSNAFNELNSRTASVCSQMKQNGIIIYSIAFGNPGTAAQTLMRDCASKDDFYFNSPDNTTLQQAFRAIGDSLANLRISK